MIFFWSNIASKMTTLWSVHAFGVIPIGSICLVLLLSDLRSLQKIAMSVCSIHISFGVIRMTLSSIFAFFAASVFMFQSLAVLSSHSQQVTTAMTVDMADRIRMKEWRNDRNWWIALFAFTVWVIVWRLQIWTRRYCFPSPPPSPKPVDSKTKKTE